MFAKDHGLLIKPHNIVYFNTYHGRATAKEGEATSIEAMSCNHMAFTVKSDLSYQPTKFNKLEFVKLTKKIHYYNKWCLF